MLLKSGMVMSAVMTGQANHEAFGLALRQMKNLGE